MSYKDYFREPDISMNLAQKIELIKFNTNAAANLASQIKAGGGLHYNQHQISLSLA